MIEDFDLIVSSFRAQYGVKIYSQEFNEMKWNEFTALLSGLGPDTPLGRMVAIRSEEDNEILKNYTKGQHRIRNEWRNRKAQNVKAEELSAVLEQYKKVFISMAGGDTH